ncbi:MAG TPA: IclR family transcriptional regulator C-terminal domain-containing protein, partial [Mycobacterium sp.]|nr:IclR family transcriptional regulator C-terminal domain-containing protein [Mycobacterium sp.]
MERTEDRSYRIALPLRMIGGATAEFCSSTLMVRRALPVLDELSRATKGEVRLGILRDNVVQLLQVQPCIHQRIHAESLQHSTAPIHAAASGKALLAFSPPTVIDRVIGAGLPAFTPHTITSPDVLRQKLTTI